MGFDAVIGPNWIVPTAPAGNSSNQVADTAFVQTAAASAVAAGTSGFVLQIQYAENTSLITSTTTMAGAVDTIPVKTDGTSIVSVTITPASTGNKLLVQGLACASNTGGNVNMWMALFQDTTTSALAAIGFAPASQNFLTDVPINFNFVAGTTSPTTISMRIGNFNGNVTTWTVNGIANTPARRLGGAMRATLLVQEIHA
jgi:hypothetical protein